jgi:hypothetical protein
MHYLGADVNKGNKKARDGRFSSIAAPTNEQEIESTNFKLLMDKNLEARVRIENAVRLSERNRPTLI